MDKGLYESIKTMTQSSLLYIKKLDLQILPFISILNQINTEKLESLKEVQEAIQNFVDSKVGQDYVKSYSKSDGKPIVDHKSKAEIIWRGLLLVFIDYYLKENQLLFDEKKFNILFNELDSFLSGTANFRHYVPLFNFNSDLEKIEFGNIIIRQVKGEEFKKIFGLSEDQFHLSAMNTVIFTNLFPGMKNYVMELVTKDVNDKNLEEEAISLDYVFSLFKSQFLGMRAIVTVPPKFNITTRSARSLEFIVGAFQQCLLNNDELERFRKLWETYEQTTKPNNFVKAIKRFNSALKERDIEDKVIDLTITLEHLFGDPDKEDTTYKLRKRAALLLAHDISEHDKIVGLIGKTYKYRSAIVHGNNPIPLTQDELNNLIEIIRKSLCVFLSLLPMFKNIKGIISQLEKSVFYSNLR